MELELLSINCFDSPLSLNRVKRIHVLVAKIIEIRPQIVCLQEITFSGTAKRVFKLFTDAGYKCVYNANKILNKGGLFVATLLPIVTSEFKSFKDQGTLDSLQVTDRLLVKGYQKLNILIGGENISLFNTHLTCVYNLKSTRQVGTLKKQLGQLMKELENENSKAILTGDLNFTPNDPLYAQMLENNKLKDPLSNSKRITVSGKNTNRQGLYKSGSDMKLDYTLLTKGLNTKSQEVIFDKTYKIDEKKSHLSDHYGLITAIDIIK